MPKQNFAEQFGRYSSIAFILPSSLVAGYLIGYLLDKAFHTDFLYLVFLLLGIVAGFIELIREITAAAKETKQGGDGK